MNIEELGSSDPGGLASAIVDGLWATAWVAALLWIARALYARWLLGRTAGKDTGTASREEDEDRSHW